MSNQFNILLMTATITPPPGVPALVRTDPQVRLQDYEKALRFYMSLLNRGIDSIVFAENSNTDISILQDIVEQVGVTEKVEFIVFEGLDYPPSYGRAYGEFKLIEYVMNHSSLLKNQDKKILVWKVTGRYIVKNIAQIIAHKPTNFDIYLNHKTIPRKWTDLYLMAWTLNGYQAYLHNMHYKILSLRDLNKDLKSQPEETFIIDLLDQSIEGIKVVRRFNVTPFTSGVRGWDNRNYSEGRNLLKFYLRSIACKLFPWLWL